MKIHMNMGVPIFADWNILCENTVVLLFPAECASIQNHNKQLLLIAAG